MTYVETYTLSRSALEEAARLGHSEIEGGGVFRQPGKYLLEQQLEQPAQLEGGALYLFDG